MGFGTLPDIWLFNAADSSFDFLGAYFVRARRFKPVVFGPIFLAPRIIALLLK